MIDQIERMSEERAENQDEQRNARHPNFNGVFQIEIVPGDVLQSCTRGTRVGRAKARSPRLLEKGKSTFAPVTQVARSAGLLARQRLKHVGWQARHEKK